MAWKLEHGDYEGGSDSEWAGYVAKLDTLFATDTVGRMYEAPRKDIERTKAQAHDLAQNRQTR